MSSKTKLIGTIGEQVLIAEFLKNEIDVLVPVGDNLPYDVVINKGGKFLKVQIKTTEKISDGKMIFSTNISNPYTKKTRKYNKDEIDLFAVYCMENNYIGLIPIEECSAKDTILRIENTKNNQTKKVKRAEKYSFEKMLDKI